MQITIPEEIIHQFLEDNEEGMRQLITYFLNAVMEEAKIQSGAMPYERTSSRKAHVDIDYKIAKTSIKNEQKHR